MPKPTRRKRQQAPRHRNRFEDRRIFDDEGVEWELARGDLSRKEVLSLLDQPSVPVGIHRNFGDALRWVPAADKQRVWTGEIEPDFFDQPNWRPPRDAPGQLPYHAVLYRRPGLELLMFDKEESSLG
jgi:hypothetical protein